MIQKLNLNYQLSSSLYFTFSLMIYRYHKYILNLNKLEHTES